jgi:hypothetical protein
MLKQLLRSAAVVLVLAAALAAATPRPAAANFSYKKCVNHHLFFCLDTCTINHGCTDTCRDSGAFC